MKKLGAIVLAIVMIAMVGAAWAADGTYNTDDGAGSLAGGNTAIRSITSGSLTLNKTLIVFNPETVNVYLPTISYTYTVAPYAVTAGNATVSDGTNTVAVKSGIAGALAVTTAPSFSNANHVQATANGTIVESDLVLSVTNVFTSAGIYRYVLTETISESALNAVGITRHDDYNTVRYIDLYVTNGTQGLEINNAVVFKASSTLDPATGDITTSTEKTTGFNEDNDGDTDYKDDTSADHYYTYNLKVEKETSGSLADLNHDFPFTIEITGIKSAKITSTQNGTSFTDVAVTSGTVGGTDLSSPTVSLSNGDYITYYGIPFGATATVKEYNNTYDTYTATGTTTGTSASVSFAADDLTASPSSYVDGTTEIGLMTGILINGGTATQAAGSETQNTDATTTAKFTNVIKTISPTGYVSRFAPYALILVGGILLLIIAKKHKKTTDEE